jgi:sn-glycerol 3-phosphate transport system ATP-binding protein
VASFIGLPEINYLDSLQFSKAGKTLGVRPENISICSAHDAGALDVTFEVLEYLGANYLIYCKYNGQTIRVLSTNAPDLTHGQRFHIKIDQEKSIYFDASSGIISLT